MFTDTDVNMIAIYKQFFIYIKTDSFKITLSDYVWSLQKLQGDVSLFQVFNNNVQLLLAGLSVEVSQEDNVETITLFPPEKKPQARHIIKKTMIPSTEFTLNCTDNSLSFSVNSENNVWDTGSFILCFCLKKIHADNESI